MSREIDITIHGDVKRRLLDPETWGVRFEEFERCENCGLPIVRHPCPVCAEELFGGIMLGYLHGPTR